MLAPIAELVPHRPPMQWLRALTDCTETTATATACFTAGHFAVVQGVVPETALIECVAQTVAAALGYRSRITGVVNPGLLAAVTKFQILSPPPLDQELSIAVCELKRLGPMVLIAGVVSCAGQVIASGELSLYV